MDIYEALIVDHKIQRDLCAQLIETKGDSKERDTLYRQLKENLMLHADAEERHFYKMLFDYDQTQGKARHGVAEHHEIDQYLRELDRTDYSSSGWLVTAKQLAEAVNHHLDDEEKKYFPVVRDIFTDQQETELAEQYNYIMSEIR